MIIRKVKGLDSKVLDLCNKGACIEGGWPQLELDYASCLESVSAIKSTRAERKWEISSAYQKSVRRGNLLIALKCISALRNVEDGLAYAWKRACVTVAEDIGVANIDLMCKVVHASAICGRKSTDPNTSAAILAQLTQEMCESAKSRVYCQLSIIEGVFSISNLFEEFTDDERTVVKAIRAAVPKDDDLSAWLRKSSWRTEGMMKFAGMEMGLATDASTNGEIPYPPYSHTLDVSFMVGLPSYCYDMHTRSGKRAINRLVEHPPISKFLKHHRIYKARSDFIGWSLFFIEGGMLIPEPLTVDCLHELELKAASNKCGVPDFTAWPELLALVVESHPLLQQHRRDVLLEMYGGSL